MRIACVLALVLLGAPQAHAERPGDGPYAEGVAHAMAGEWEAAERSFRRATEVDPEWPTAWQYLAICYDEYLQRPQDAARAYARVLELQPGNARAEAALRRLGPPRPAAPAGLSSRSEVDRPPAAPTDPVTVVQTLLAAQARGDVEGVLGLLAMEGADPRAQAAARRGFTAVARKARISEVQTQVRARRAGERLAVVRLAFQARVAAAGEEAREEGGALAILVRERGAWRVRALHPDELLAIEAMGSRERRTGHGLLPVVHADEEVPWVAVERLNQAIDRAVLTTVLDEHKLLQDSHFSGAGAIPGVGDWISAGYTIYDRYRTLVHELPQDMGSANVEATLTDLGLLGWGVVQVLTEPVPLLDNAADAVGAGLDQWKYNRTQKYAFLRLRGALLAQDYRAFPKYLAFRGFEGLPVEARGLYDLKAGAELQGKAVQTFAVLSDTPARTGARARFEVGVEVRILASESEALFEAARTLKVPIRAIPATAPAFKPDFVAAVPVRLPGAAREIAIDGPQVALEPRLDEGVSFRFGCQRGIEKLQVVLADGTRTAPVVFENRVFNQVNGIQVRTGDGRVLERISLREGEALDGLEVVGRVESDGFDAPGPLLTGCARVSVGDPAVAELRTEGHWPTAMLGLTGRAAGATRLTVIVGSGSLAVEKAFGHVPVEVTGKSAPLPRLEGEWHMEATVERSSDPSGSPGDSGRVRFQDGHFEMYGPDESGEQRWLDLGSYGAQVEAGRLVVVVSWLNPLTHDHQSWHFDLAPTPTGLSGTFTATSHVGSDRQEMSGRVSFRR